MISMIKGVVALRGDETAVVEVQGIGYELFVPAPQLVAMNPGSNVVAYTHEVIREDRRELFGFGSREELEFFRRIIGVSGVGPKTALHVLSLGLDKVREAIGKGNATFLSSAPGVGTKTAQKIVLELKGVIAEVGRSAGKGDEIVDALVGLGYGRPEAADAVHALPADLSDSEERLRAALKLIVRK